MVFVSWESMIQVHLRHSRALKFIVLGFRNSSIDLKKSHFGSFLGTLGQFCSLFVAEHVYDPFYMVYVMGIVASGTLEEF